MAYIGRQPTRGQNREIDDISGSFNAILTSFDLTVSGTAVYPASTNQLFVSVGGVLQNPSTDYTISADKVTFTTAPASGLSFFAIMQGDTVDINTPADGSVTEAKLGSGLGYVKELTKRNLVINGSFQVDQRAGQGAGATFMADRFISNPDGGTATSSRGTLTTGSPYNEGFRYFGRVTNTAVITDTAAHYRFVNYKGFEAQDIAQSGWKYTDATSFVTLSFWVRSSVGGVFYGYLNAIDGTNSSLAFLIAGDGDSSLVADAWTKVTVTVPGHANLSFDLNVNNGLNLYISPFLGTNRTASSVTAGVWQNYDGSARTPDAAGGQTWATTAGATWDLTGVQLEVGAQATPFPFESYGQTLAKCQRYLYAPLDTSVSSEGIGAGTWYGTTQIYVAIPHPVTMRAKPTFTGIASGAGGGYFLVFSAGTAEYLSSSNGIVSVQATSTTNSIIGANNWRSSSDGGGSTVTFTSGNGGWLEKRNASAQIFFDAEL